MANRYDKSIKIAIHHLNDLIMFYGKKTKWANCNPVGGNYLKW